MASTLVRGAVSITITEQGTPACRAASATPCAGVAGADGPHAVAPLLGAELPDGVVGAANLERPDRLQCFELEEDLGPTRRCAGRVGQFQADQRRANDQIVDGARGGLNLVKRNLTHTETSMLTRSD